MRSVLEKFSSSFVALATMVAAAERRSRGGQTLKASVGQCRCHMSDDYHRAVAALFRLLQSHQNQSPAESVCGIFAQLHVQGRKRPSVGQCTLALHHSPITAQCGTVLSWLVAAMPDPAAHSRSSDRQLCGLEW